MPKVKRRKTATTGSVNIKKGKRVKKRKKPRPALATDPPVKKVKKAKLKQIEDEARQANDAKELLRQKLVQGEVRCMYQLEAGDKVHGVPKGGYIYAKLQMTNKLIAIKYEGSSNPPHARLQK